MRTEQNREMTQQAFAGLRQFARRSQRNVEVCEMCSAELRHEHPHLIEISQRKLICACDACALLFSGQANAKYKRVPRDVRMVAEFHMRDEEWEALLIPINLAFFFRNSATSRVSAFYPSPAGATESLLPLEDWNGIVRANPVLNSLEPDVEALLVNRVAQSRGVSRAEYYIVPIDACYKLVGLIRLHWKGLSGGTEVWQEIAGFFNELKARAQIVREESHA
jgi:Family of unknown function (DUF5947)